MKKRITLLILAGICALNACYYDKEQLLIPPKSTAGSTCLNYSFTNDVNPLIVSRCNSGSGCHGSGSTSGPGELITFTEIKNASAQIQSSVLAGRMPLGSTLTTAQIQIINCWINNGSLSN